MCESEAYISKYTTPACLASSPGVSITNQFMREYKSSASHFCPHVAMPTVRRGRGDFEGVSQVVGSLYSAFSR